MDYEISNIYIDDVEIELDKFIIDKNHMTIDKSLKYKFDTFVVGSNNKLSDITTDKETLRKISKIMGNDTALSKDYRYKLMEHLSNALEDGATQAEVQMIMDRYQSGEIIYDRMLEELKELGEVG